MPSYAEIQNKIRNGWIYDPETGTFKPDPKTTSSNLNKTYNDRVYDYVVSELTKNSDYAKYLNDTGALRGFLNNNYLTESKNINNLWGLLGTENTYDIDSALAHLAQLSELNELYNDIPEAPNYEQIYDDAVNAIETENNAITAKWDEDVNRRTNLFNQQLSDSNAAYNQNVEQILSNDYQNNARLLGTMRSEMQRSQRNALEAGASAGIRIAGNINTMLSAQNQQAQQSLATSNNLAQMLLNQQQANAGLRNDYADYMSQDTQRRTDLTSSTADRAASRTNTNFGIKNTIYGQKIDDYENAVAGLSGTNPFASSYQAYKQGQSYLNKLKNKTN